MSGVLVDEPGHRLSEWKGLRQTLLHTTFVRFLPMQAKIYDRDGRSLGEFVRGDMYIRDARNTKVCCMLLSRIFDKPPTWDKPASIVASQQRVHSTQALPFPSLCHGRATSAVSPVDSGTPPTASRQSRPARTER